MSFALSPEEVRVLGALIEKQNTTPDYYPMTLNALMHACNQKSNREPVVAYDESTVIRAIDRLRDRGLAFRVSLADSRVEKFEQSLDKKLGLTLQETAALCVLMLRGPQTLGEIRARAARIYPFESMEEARAALESLTDREDDPLAVRLPLQPGRKEARYAHLLSGEPDIPAETPLAPPAASDNRIDELAAEVARLREEMAIFKREFAEFKSQFE